MTSGASLPEIKPASLVRISDETSAFPGLDRVGAQFALGLIDVLAANGDPGAKVCCGDTAITTFEDWRNCTVDTRAVLRYRMAPLKGGVLLSLPQAYVSRLVDRFYGGDGNVAAPRKELSAAEDRFLARLGDTIATLLAVAWAEMVAVEAVAVKRDHSGSLPTLVVGTRQVAVQVFSVEVSAGKSVAIELVYPLSLLRAVPQLVAAPESEEAPQIDPVWKRGLSDAVMQVRLPVRTIFARPELPLAQLLNLAVGDIIPVCLPSHVPVTIAGRLFARASVGDSNGRTAIKIECIEEGSTVYE